jgi:hypothetical protein
VHLEAQDLAVAIGRQFRPRHVIAAMGIGEE